MNVSARGTLWFLLSVSVVLFVLSLASGLAFVTPGGINVPRIVYFRLDANREATVLAWFSSLLLFVAALLLAAIGWMKSAARDRYARQWAALAVVFLLLSLDEAVALHETIGPLTRKLGLGGLFYYSWVIVGFTAVIAFGLVFMRFWLSLESRPKLLFLFAAALFIGGAIGVEMASGFVDEVRGKTNPAYVILASIEELMEMLGVSVFIYALLDHIRSLGGEIVLRVE
jgi:hypothetical protein